MDALAAALKNAKNLTALSLRDNQLSQEGKSVGSPYPLLIVPGVTSLLQSITPGIKCLRLDGAIKGVDSEGSCPPLSLLAPWLI